MSGLQQPPTPHTWGAARFIPQLVGHLCAGSYQGPLPTRPFPTLGGNPWPNFVCSPCMPSPIGGDPWKIWAAGGGLPDPPPPHIGAHPEGGGGCSVSSRKGGSSGKGTGGPDMGPHTPPISILITTQASTPTTPNSYSKGVGRVSALHPPQVMGLGGWYILGRSRYPTGSLPAHR